MITQIRDLALAQQDRLARDEASVGVEMKGDKFCEQFEHADNLEGIQHARFGIDGAQGSEERTVRKNNRHRDIAPKAIQRRRRMVAVDLTLRYIIDDDR